jgi:hypothetical protein
MEKNENTALSHQNFLATIHKQHFAVPDSIEVF